SAALVDILRKTSPLHAFAVKAEPQNYSASRKGSSLTSAEARLGSAWPAVGMTSEVAVGGVWRETGTEWTGRGELGLRLPLHLLARLKAERAPYLWTVASLETPVMTETGTALLTWSDPRGWSGEAAASVQRYADGNRVRSSYAWFLAPVIRAPSGGVEIGYGVSVQDADQLRYALPTRSSDGTLIPARFDPYFTPIATQAHSLTAAAGWKGGRAALRAGGAYGFYAREDAPFAIVGSPQPGLVTRSFHPWNLRARLDVPLSRGVTATAGTELFATAFYTYRALDLGLFVRFLGSAAREPR
ncbi:MAG: hypothetical protein M3409_07885, partial [Gemmatimonadota bacterium]|nr:hypothetical protein [Gemmatimonadota bacterium]